MNPESRAKVEASRKELQNCIDALQPHADAHAAIVKQISETQRRIGLDELEKLKARFDGERAVGVTGPVSLVFEHKLCMQFDSSRFGL